MLCVIGIGMPGPTELLIVLGIFVLLLGATKLPQLGRSLGSAINEFKDSVKGKEEKEEEQKNKTDAGDEDTV